jgi:hypothetical protein
MKLIVVDASVILKWVFPPDTEAYQIEARRLGTALGNGEMILCAADSLVLRGWKHPEPQASRKTAVLA